MAKRVSSIYGNALFELAVEEKKVDALYQRCRHCSRFFLRMRTYSLF